MAKIAKAQAGYLPQQFVATEGTSCGTCRDFIRLSSECMVTAPAKVDAKHGTCILYLRGKTHEYGMPRKIIPQNVVGYIEGPEVPTRCGLCKHYEHPDRPYSTCEGVGDSEDDEVQTGGCCNLYEMRTRG